MSRTSAMQQRYLQLLQNIPLFKEAKLSDLQTLVTSARTTHVERKQIIFKRGDPCNGFYILVQGQIKLSLIASAQGTEKLLDKPLEFVKTGGTFGDITMFLERPYYLNAQALEDSLLIFIPREAILSLIEKDSRFAMRMLASLSMRMRNVVDDIESFSLQPPAARLITYLMRLLPSGAMTSATIELSINKNIVAAHLNLTPETLSRYFKTLTNLGLVSLNGKTVLVHDIDRLGNYLNSQINSGTAIS